MPNDGRILQHSQGVIWENYQKIQTQISGPSTNRGSIINYSNDSTSINRMADCALWRVFWDREVYKRHQSDGNLYPHWNRSCSLSSSVKNFFAATLYQLNTKKKIRNENHSWRSAWPVRAEECEKFQIFLITNSFQIYVYLVIIYEMETTIGELNFCNHNIKLISNILP